VVLRGNILKFKELSKILAVFLLFVGEIALASGGSVLSELKEGRNNFTLEYNVTSREVRLTHKSGWEKSPRYKRSFSVNTDAEVAVAIESIEAYLNSVEVPAHVIPEFVQKLQELQYLNMSQCQVIHFHSLTPGGKSNFGELLSEVERINALERMGPESFRSVPLFDISMEAEGEFQVRGVLNKDSDIIKLSIVRKDGPVKDYKIEKEGDEYRFFTPKGEVLFILRPDLNGSEPGKVLLLTPRSTGVQNVSLSFFSLKKDKKKWKVNIFSTKPQMDSGLDSVPLLRFDVEHEAVLKVNGTDKYFKALDEEELEELLEKEGFQEKNRDHLSALAKKEFARCMLNRIQEGLKGDVEAERDLCLLVAQIELTHENIKKVAAIKLEEVIDDKIILNESIKTISDEFRSCLGSEKGFEQKRDYLSFNYSYLRENLKSSKAVLARCEKNLSSSIVKIILSEEIRTNSDIADIIPEGEVFENFLKEVLEEGYESCLEVREEKFDECGKFASLYKDTLVFSADISHRYWQKNERSKENLAKHGKLISSYKGCVNNVHEGLIKDPDFQLALANEKQNNCAAEVLLGLGIKSNNFSFSKIIKEIEFFKGKELEISEDLEKKANETYEECFSEAVKEIGSSLEQYDSSKYLCALSAAKEIIPELYSKILLEDFEDYVWSEEQKESLKKYTERLIKRRISDLESPKNISEALEKEVPTILSKALNGVVDLIMVGNFSDEDNYLFNSEAQKALEKKLFYLIGGNSYKPLSYEMKLFVKKEFDKNGLRGAKLGSNAFLQNFVKEAMPFIAIKDIGNDVFIKQDRETIAGIVDKDMQACLDQFKPDSEVSFESVYKYCEKKRFGLTKFLLAKREFETQVSHHFTLSSDAGNRALTPVHYMKECIDDLDNKKMEVGDYEKYVQTCVDLTRIKISSRIDRERVKKFKPYMRSHDGGSERYSGMTSAYCHSILFVQMTSELGDKELGRKIHDTKNKLVASMLSEGDAIYDEELMSAMVKSGKLDSEWFKTKLKKCRDGTHTFLMSGLKNYLVKMIPASAYSSTNRVGQSNKEVLESFLDAELLELVLQLKVQVGDKGGELNSAEDDPAQKVVTSTLTLEALSNFMKILGGYISDGFIYDKDKMKTELVIFREELKTALKWVNNQQRPIRIAELGDFFTESTFADHLAQATISEMVRENFNDFLRDMEQNELRASRQGSGHSQKDIKAKFVKLRAHTKKMTEYYDFRHIIRPKSQKGGKLLTLIKENNLLPRLLGDEVSSYTKEKINSDVANMILGDNTEGGFAELFVREVAQLELSKKKASHWGITRFLFYDTGDFDWGTLRKTKAGKKAIDYYGRNILLPKMLGKDLSAYEEKLKMNRFREILDDAISEND